MAELVPCLWEQPDSFPISFFLCAYDLKKKKKILFNDRLAISTVTKQQNFWLQTVSCMLYLVPHCYTYMAHAMVLIFQDPFEGSNYME